MRSATRQRRWHRRTLAIATSALAAGAFLVAAQSSAGGAAPAVPEVADQVPQLTEAGVTGGPASVTGGASSQASSARSVCAPGAQWLRVRFTELALRGHDSVTLTGSGSGSFTLTARNWPGKAFHTRAFEGDCVRVSAALADPASRFAIDSYQAGDRALAAATSTVAAVGDVCGASCNQTAPLVKNMNPQALILAGDNAYSSGTLSEYNSNYHPYYGQFRSITYPTPGNHEYNTSGAAGYFDYFGKQAGERGKGYYSFDVGDWHFVALNSNITRTAGSAQVTWLKNDLAASTKPCTAAFFHHPRFSRGTHGDDTSVTPFFQTLYDAKADLVVVGHDHNYQRFAQSRPDGKRDDVNGVRQLLIGTGGRGYYSFDQSSAAEQEVGNTNTFGVSKLTLTATGYRSDFVPVSGRTFTDSTTGKCKKAASSPAFSVGTSPSSVSVKPGGTASVSVTVASTGGFTSATALSVSGLPSGVTGTISPSSVTPPANGTATATLTLTASAGATGSATATVTGSSGSVSQTATVAVSVGSGGGEAFSDDFETDKGWRVDAAGSDTATSGKWERGDPEETTSTYSDQVKQRGDTTSGANCLVTGRLAGSEYGANDLDGGASSMTSPSFTVPSGGKLTFSYTFAHGDNATSADYLRIRVLDGTTPTTVFEKLGSATEVAGAWQTAAADLSSFAGRSVRLLVEAADASTASLWESAVDDLRVTA
ncbi:metallophosphoesterase [Amycolatopsis sp. BJA-103]|uniref:metallophosphoesterase n=1 Tax=Amycolatopsis sp. BJA-103 TaxID=1911175 RepID=UPI000C7922EC|nr:metallophosphoesterase [Amycolatopsis sp. BJA-103]AUI59350.1 metallophosphoesterase [Amycolatopsis sp. BJA-103]PNE17208.1 metallophosphoesterase [Amycolatopsis sp. BJA-103]